MNNTLYFQIDGQTVRTLSLPVPEENDNETRRLNLEQIDRMEREIERDFGRIPTWKFLQP